MEVRIPDDLWDSGENPEGVIVNWFYKEGATVEAGVALVEIMVEKTQYELAAPAAGTLHIIAEPDTIVTPGSVIAEIG